MKRGLVSIGVDRTDGLGVLTGAAAGARELADWAQKQGIDTVCLSDGAGPVFIAEIKRAIKQMVDARIYHQLIVFFSGHGFLRAPDVELWLLSGAPDDPQEAVDVANSIWLARNAGIPHVVFVSDACRSVPPTGRHAAIGGAGIFPNRAPSAPRPDVDVFYATLPGDTALELPADDALRSYDAVFTRCLMRGLKGGVSELVEPFEPGSSDWVVRSWPLKRWLLKEVPESAAAHHISLNQDPDIRVESTAPAFLARVDAPKPTGPVRGEPPLRPPQDEGPDPRIETLAKEFGQPERFVGSFLRGGSLEALRSPESRRRFQEARLGGRARFETMTGFTVYGAQVKAALVDRASNEILHDGPVTHIRIGNGPRPESSRCIALLFEGGTGTGLGVLPGFIGTVIVEEGRVVNVSYRPSDNSPEYAEYADQLEEIERRRAFMALAARRGLLKLGANEAIELAGYLRVDKRLDPTLGIYAAYAYAQAGMMDEIKSIYDIMRYSDTPVPFDIALLAGRMQEPQVLAPHWPMLTQGWSLLERDEDLALGRALWDAKRHLLPGLWTTLAGEGVMSLWDHIEREA